MTTKTLLSLATVSLLAFAAKAYTVETTNSWFSVDAASENLSNGKWTGSPTKPESRIVVDTEAGSPVTYTPSETRPTASTRYRVTGNMTVTLNAGEPAAYTGDNLPKAALVAVAGSPNKWYGWDGDSWEDLSSGIETAPVEGTSYDVAIEFFVETSNETPQLKIKYIVGTESKTVTTSGSALPTLTYVGLAGYGSFGDFGALGFDSFEVTVTISDEVKAKMGIEGDEITPAALNKLGANGLTKWESIVLGLPDQNTKPYTAPVQTNNGNLGFTIGNVDTSKYGASGASVKFDVIELSGPNEKTGTLVSENNTAGSTAEVTAPDVSSGVKYYKIKIKFQ